MAHYDDPEFSYEEYWRNRRYEHLSEVAALDRLLAGKHFGVAADIGGGFGRLTPVLASHSRETILVEPSAKMRRLAVGNFKVVAGQADRTGFLDGTLDCAMVVRVFHHIPDLGPVFGELSRIIKRGGYLVFEFANSLNFKSRLGRLFLGQSVPDSPVEKRSQTNIRRSVIPFVNHSPSYIERLLVDYRFTALETLSVSNLRWDPIKSGVPLSILLILERLVQPVLAKVNFGPSIFILARRDS